MIRSIMLTKSDISLLRCEGPGCGSSGIGPGLGLCCSGDIGASFCFTTSDSVSEVGGDMGTCWVASVSEAGWATSFRLDTAVFLLRFEPLFFLGMMPVMYSLD